ncbi:hypothetical protein K8I85_03840 [bacterium]|nr:hypothetical protein [bacterium]
MGGLSAIFHADGASADAEVLRRMDATIAHRGEKGGERAAGSIGLAHRRTPASSVRDQPVVAEGGRLSVVLHGRLYNRVELDASLPPSPTPRSDADILLECYRARGPRFVSDLDGDFAFVLHDAAQGRVLCARDAIGIKTLYYAFDGRRFLAASEPKQLLAAGVSDTPCEETLGNYLSMARHLIGGGGTYFDDIRAVRPGEFLVVDANGIEREEHWRLDPSRVINEDRTEGLVERVRALMEDAVRRRLPVDPPFACALSGGFDSSSVAAMTRRELRARGVDAPIETFSFEFRAEDADEPEVIRAVANAVGAHHHSVWVDEEDAVSLLPEMVRVGDEPARDLGLLVLYRKKQRAAEQGVSTLLSGLGGDELFMGRLHYFADLLRAGRWGLLRREIRGVHPVDPSTGKRTSLPSLLGRYLARPLSPRSLKNLVRRMGVGEPIVGPWIRPEFARRSGLADRVEAGAPRVFRDFYRQDCFEVFRYELVEATLPIQEALGASFALDTRFPLLSRELVETMFAAPRQTKISQGASRVLQRRAMEGILPDAVLEEHLKKDFHGAMIRQQRPHLERALGEMLSRKDRRSEEYVDWRWIADRRRELVAGGSRSWRVLVYALSVERWLDALARGSRID